jgi:hypothetical protein
MAVDPGILGVLGGWSPETAQAAAPEYARKGLAFLAPEADFTGSQASPPVEAGFAAEYQALSGGAPPGQAAVWAYAEANRLLDAIDETIQAERNHTRAGVLAVLSGSH